MLRVRDLTLALGGEQQAYRIELPHLVLEAGQAMAITGASGSGKTTLLQALGLMQRPESLGEFSLGDPGVDLSADVLHGRQKRLARIRSQHIGFVLQTGGLLPFLSARENIMLPRRRLGLPVQTDTLADAMDRLDVGHLMDRLPSTLSVGQRQRVCCLRALAHEPGLVLADEPTAALDPLRAHAVFALLLELARDRACALLVVTHDEPLVRAFDLPVVRAHTEGSRTVFESSPQAQCA